MVQCGSLSIRQYCMPLFSLMYLIFATGLPTWNLILIGVDGKLSQQFPYPFSLIFIEFFFATLLFLLLNITERFLIPYIIDHLIMPHCSLSNDANAVFKVNQNGNTSAQLDNESVGFYQTESIQRPGLYQPIDFNKPVQINAGGINATYTYEQHDDEADDSLSDIISVQKRTNTISVLGSGAHHAFCSSGYTNTDSHSQLTQFSCASNASFLSRSPSNMPTNGHSASNSHTSHIAEETKTNTVNTAEEEQSMHSVSWCLDRNLWLKLKLTFKTGSLFGLNAAFFIAALLFIPINLDLLIHSCVLLIITLYTKLVDKSERIDLTPLLFALFAVLFILPFCVINTFHGDTLYLDNKRVANGTLYIVISAICDFISAVLLMCIIISMSSLIRMIKPSRLRFEDDREPSIIEIAFFISFWSTCILFIPCIICDLCFHSEHILSSNNNSSNYHDSIMQLIFDTHDIYKYLILSIFTCAFYIYSFVACLCIMSILSVAILYELSVITHAIIYLNFVAASPSSNTTDQPWWKWLCLMLAYLSCVLYGVFRIIENKRNSHLSWNEWLNRANRIDSAESFNTLLAPKQTHRQKHKTNANGNGDHALKGKEKKKKRNVIDRGGDDEDDEQSILSISSISIKENDNEFEDRLFMQRTPRNRVDSPDSSKRKRFTGPNMHNNRFGIPDYVQTPPPKQIDDTKQDFLFHSQMIRENVQYYHESSKSKNNSDGSRKPKKKSKKRKHKKHKKRNKKKHENVVSNNANGVNSLTTTPNEPALP